MKSVSRALPMLLAAVPAALANPDLLVDQRIHAPEVSYSSGEMEDGTLVVNAWGQGLKVFARDPLSGEWISSQPTISEARGGAIDLEDGLLVVGEFDQAVYVLERDASGRFVVTATLTEPDAALTGANFATCVSTDGERIAVGCASPDYTVAHAHVFERDANGTWQPTLIEPPSGFGDLAFARALVLQGDALVVGATYLIDAALQPGEGAAFVYRGGGGNWSLDPVAPRLFDPQQGPGAGALFGSELDVDQGTLVIGAVGGHGHGSVCVFQRDPQDGHFALHPSTWLLVPPQADFDANHKGFSGSLSVQGDTIAVGSVYTHVTPGGLQGAVYLFERDGAGQWSPSSLLPMIWATPTADDLDDHFGAKVDLDGEYLAVTRDAYGKEYLGSVHVFSGPFAAHDLHHLQPDPQATWTGLAVGSIPNLKSVYGPQGVLLDWDIPLAPTPGLNDLLPAKLLDEPGLELRVVSKPDPALLAPDNTIPFYPSPFEWYPDGSFLLIPAAGFTGVIEWEYAWFVGELQVTDPATVVVIVGDPRRRGELPPLRR